MRLYSVTAGSVIGREHVRLARNNQDGVGLRVEPDLIVAAVTDGCSGARASEVGAKLGAEWLVAAAPRYLSAAPDLPARVLARALLRGLLSFLKSTAQAISPRGTPAPDVVADYFLFTVICAIVAPNRALVFSAGDGLVAIDGELTILDSGESNAPRYPAYALLESADLDGEVPALDPQIHCDRPTPTIRSLMIATDGARELARKTLDELLADPRYATNPTLLHKRLAALGASRERLHDDTSIVVIRREAEATETGDAA